MIKLSIFILTIIAFNTEVFLRHNTENIDWQLSKNEKEIFVYTRNVGYSDYKEFKSEMTVTSTPDVIMSFLRNIGEYKEWLPDCLESKKLKQINTTEQINYILTDVPWPFEDRDLVYHFTVINNNFEPIKILIENKPEYIPSKKDIIRIPKSKGFWTITPIDEHKTKVVYQMHVEPGGYVPAWLYNLKIVDTPFTFLFNLRQQVEKE